MSNAIKLKIHKIKCIDKQEIYKDEIILWGVMVCNNNLFMVTPTIPERSFWEGSVKNFNPPADLITIPLSTHDIQNIVIARAAVWVVERDDWTQANDISIHDGNDLNIDPQHKGANFWRNNGNEAYRLFHSMYNRKLTELNNTNPGVNHAIEAFKAILPAYHNGIVNATSGVFIDDDEVFPYINTEFRSNPFPPLRSETSPVSVNIKEAHGGKYEVDLSWSLEIG